MNYGLLSSVLKDNKVRGSFFMCISNLVDQDMSTCLIYCLAIRMNTYYLFVLFNLWLKASQFARQPTIWLISQ